MIKITLLACVLMLATGLDSGYSNGFEEPLLPTLERLEVRSGDGGKSASVGGVLLSGIPAGQLEVLAQSLSQRIGDEIRPSDAAAIADEIVAHCEGNGLPVVMVFLPEQDFEDGRLVIELEVARVGQISKTGDSRLSDAQILQNFGLDTGDPLEGGVLQAAIDRLNRNPFRSAEVLAAEGAGENEADLLIHIEETRPWRWFTGYDNAGSVFVEEDRLFTGFQWGNAFGRDHELSYQFTTSPTPDLFTAHSALWEIPLPWHHRLALQGSLSEVEASVAEGGAAFDSQGSTWDLAARYEVPLDPLFRSWGLGDLQRQIEFRQTLSLGFEFRSTDNDVVFGGQSLFASKVETAQFVAGYDAELKDPWGQNELELRYAWSPGGITGANSTEDFNAVRNGATADYTIARAELTRAQRLPANFSLRLRAGAQWTDDQLLPSEQLAIGGYATVRSLSEREFLADRGYWLSSELRLPPVEGLSRWLQEPGQPDQIQVYGFLDHAGIDGTSSGAGADSESFASTGVGLRWNLFQHLRLRLDHGWLLDGEGGDDSRTLLGVTATF